MVMENKSQKNLYDRLVHHFDIQIQNYQSALSLVQKQRRALANHKLPELVEVNLELDQIANLMEEEDLKRNQLMEVIVPNWFSKAQNHLKTKKKPLPLLEFLKELPDEYVHLLNQKISELKKCVLQLQNQNRMNAQLIDASRQINKSTIELITRLALPSQENATPTYAAKGSMNTSAQKPRNLIQIKA